MFLVGIAGGSGSGKTTFGYKVKKYSESSQIEILNMDSYYSKTRSDSIMTSKGRPNFDHPDAFDWPLLREHLTSLKNKNPISVPVYDFKTSSRTSEIMPLGPVSIVIFEGIFSLYDHQIRELLDIKCFLQVDSDIRFTRRLHRDIQERGRSLDSVIEQYYDTVRPMYEKFLAPQKQFADFIVGEETDVAAQILASRLKEVLLSNNE